MMFRKLGYLIAVVAFTSGISSATFAQDIRFSNGDSYASNGHMRAGVYLKIPFRGGLKYNKKEKLKFGAALGFTRGYRTSNTMFAKRKQFTVNLLDLKFDNQGFNAIALSGQDILIPQDGQVVFATDKDGKLTLGKAGLYTLAAIGGAVIIVTAVFVLKKDEPDSYFSIQ